MSLSNQKCEIQATVINLHPNEYNQELHYHPFAVKLDKCAGSCNTLNDLSNKVCVPNKTEDLNIHGIMINVYVSVKNKIYVKKIIFGIVLHVVVKMENIYQVLRMIQRLRVMKLYDEETKTITTNFNEKKATCKTQNLYILLAFLLTAIPLLIAVSIYYFIKYQAKKKRFITIPRHK